MLANSCLFIHKANMEQHLIYPQRDVESFPPVVVWSKCEYWIATEMAEYKHP